MVRVCCAGHVNWDVTLRVDELPAPDGESRIHAQRAAGGGSAANVAAALASLDVPTGIVGAVGADENGLLARRELEQAGVDTEPLLEVPEEATTVKYLLVEETGEVAVLGNVGANEAIGPEDVDPGYLIGTEHLHLTSQRPETAARLAEIADQEEIPISFDPGRRLAERDFSEALSYADLVFVNDREAEALLEDTYPVARDSIVVLKRGSDGAEVHAPDGGCSHSGFDVDSVDTTGAGDAFAAGFIAVTLDGGTPEQALEFANACGALAARQEGARSAPSVEAVRRFLEERGDN